MNKVPAAYGNIRADLWTWRPPVAPRLAPRSIGGMEGVKGGGSWVEESTKHDGLPPVSLKPLPLDEDSFDLQLVAAVR